MKKKKFYILSVPCSGKSHFVKENKGVYKVLKVYDFDKLKPHRNYKALKKLEKWSVVLGGITGRDLKMDLSYCPYVSVIIPYNDVLKYLKKRVDNNEKKKKKWSRLYNIEKARKELIEYSRKNNIPIFNSFEKALDYLIEEYYEKHKTSSDTTGR